MKVQANKKKKDLVEAIPPNGNTAVGESSATPNAPSVWGSGTLAETVCPPPPHQVLRARESSFNP